MHVKSHVPLAELKRLERAERDDGRARRLRLFFQEESRFGQQATTTHVWARKGSHPTAVRQTEYEPLWVLGAVCRVINVREGPGRKSQATMR